MVGQVARTRSLGSALGVWGLVLLAAVLGWIGRGWWQARHPPPGSVLERAPPEPPPDRLELRPASFDDLPGWTEDRLVAALPALRRSCAVLLRQPADRPLGGARDGRVAGTAGDWRAPCAALRALPVVEAPGTRAVPGVPAVRNGSATKISSGSSDLFEPGDPFDLRAIEAEIRTFFETRFRPWAVSNRGDPLGLFTGYYEPTLEGSRRRSERFRVPLYLRPPDLVTIDLGEFRDDLEGRRLAGRLEGHRLVPYPDRAAIDAGRLAGRGLELVWVDDPVDAFFLHIQGSGRIELAEGGHLRVGYAGQNGRPYFAIGRELIDRGALTPEEVSMQSIRRWLEEHPEEAADVLHRNPSYVFFRELREDGPVGSQGVLLTPGRSLAVDRMFLPLGVPVWLDGSAPLAGRPETDTILQRLLVAQDTGGAIRGPVRGDVFWGPGDAAADVAGRMKHPGRIWILLPRSVEATTRRPSDLRNP